MDVNFFVINSLFGRKLVCQKKAQVGKKKYTILHQKSFFSRDLDGI